MSNQIYMVAAAVLALGIIFFLLKKVFKLAMIIIILALAYGGYIYMTDDDPAKTIQKKLDQGKSTMQDLDKATREVRRESIDQVIDQVDKQLKEAAKKKGK